MKNVIDMSKYATDSILFSSQIGKEAFDDFINQYAWNLYTVLDLSGIESVDVCFFRQFFLMLRETIYHDEIPIQVYCYGKPPYSFNELCEVAGDQIDFPFGFLFFGDEINVCGTDERIRKIIKLMPAGMGLSTSDVHEKIGIDNNKINNMLNELHKSGTIDRDSDQSSSREHRYFFPVIDIKQKRQ